MVEMNPDVWFDRDFPVLREAARIIDEGEDAHVQALLDATGLDDTQLLRALNSLERRGLITVGRVLAGPYAIEEISGEAYLLTGLHPRGEDAIDRLIDALLQAAEQATEPEQKRSSSARPTHWER